MARWHVGTFRSNYQRFRGINTKNCIGLQNCGPQTCVLQIFICSRFERQGKHISEELAKRICETVDGNSSYVQQLAWNVLAETEQTTTEEDFCRGVDALLAQCSALFEEQLKGLTSYQLNFIRALCDGVTSDFGSKAILESYNLGSKSNISRIKASLQDKEMIDFDKNSVYLEDPVFKIWYKRNK